MFICLLFWWISINSFGCNWFLHYVISTVNGKIIIGSHRLLKSSSNSLKFYGWSPHVLHPHGIYTWISNNRWWNEQILESRVWINCRNMSNNNNYNNLFYFFIKYWLRDALSNKYFSIIFFIREIAYTYTVPICLFVTFRILYFH